jgi:hypothetical protein
LVTVSALCSLYVFWFRKPKDVKLQTFLDLSGADNFAAFLYFGSMFRDSICPIAPNAVNFLYGHGAIEHQEKSAKEDVLSMPLDLTDPRQLMMVSLIKRFEAMTKGLEGG